MLKLVVSAIWLFAGFQSCKKLYLDESKGISVLPPVLENDSIRVGLNLELGGAITYLASKIDSQNLINNYDWGRQVQMSFYSHPVPYAPNGKQPEPRWANIGWNPIQSGDYFGNKSELLEYANDGSEIYIKTVPKHWPLDNEPCNCEFESWISLDGNRVKVRARLNNSRVDTNQYPGRHQELPAVYTNAAFHNIVTYTGTNPFAWDTIDTIDNENISGPVQWSYWQSTEKWAATLNDDGWGLGILNNKTQNYVGGFAGQKGVSGGTNDAPTAYIAPIRTEILDSDIKYDYDYTLIVGSLEQIRGYVYDNADRPTLPDYDFIDDREGWYYQNVKDTGWPIAGQLDITQTTNNANIVGPSEHWEANSNHNLYIEMALEGTAGTMQAYWRKHGSSTFGASDHIGFSVINDGEFRTYTVPIGTASGYAGYMSGIKFVPPGVYMVPNNLKIRKIYIQ
ncbi:MAG TPA: hypothetical protein VNQ80_14180 [Parapedobacter sp.]|nr:hypothetical protein [Parapedobacter sp.]